MYVCKLLSSDILLMSLEYCSSPMMATVSSRNMNEHKH